MGVCGAVGGDGGGIEKVSDIMSVSAGERTGAGPDAACGRGVCVLSLIHI